MQRLQEDPLPTALAVLSTWSHRTRNREITKNVIDSTQQLLSTEDAASAVKELRQPKSYIPGTKGSKLQLRVILTLLDDRSLETNALLDSGSTGSCINRKYVEEHGIPTRKLPIPIPVYNADGSFNQDGAITEVVDFTSHDSQDHSEKIALAVSNLGKSDVFIGTRMAEKAQSNHRLEGLDTRLQSMLHMHVHH